MNLLQRFGFRAQQARANEQADWLALTLDSLEACILARRYIKARTLCPKCRDSGINCNEHLQLWAETCDALDAVIAQAERQAPTTYIAPGDCAAHEIEP